MAAFALVDILEDCHTFLWLDAALVDPSNTTPDQPTIDYGVGCRSALYLPSQDFISWQLSAHQELEDGLGP